LQEFTTPLKARFDELMADRGELERILAKGAETAQEIAQPLVDDVYEKVGFLPRRRK
ncbi:tryptophan--tRNA ligase, partial [Corynebacterium kefirresidentii]|nr:tryptophan--tRNA ligase [Corynebacterium kefirresidentii]